MSCDVLLHAEDPGAANVLAPLVPVFVERGYGVRLCAGGAALVYLAERGIAAEPQFGDAAAILERHGPRLLLAGTSEEVGAMGHALTDEARRRGIVTIGAVDMLANADGRFRGLSGDVLCHASDVIAGPDNRITPDYAGLRWIQPDPLCHAPDVIAVPDRATAQAFRALGVAEGRIALCGHPHFDVVRARRAMLAQEDQGDLRNAAFPGLDPERPVIVFLAEGVDRLNPAASRVAADAALKGSGTTDDRTTVVLEELLAAVAPRSPRPQIVLRLHPKNDPDAYARLHDRIDLVSRGGDPLALVSCADLVVGMTTFLLVEASLLGRPTLSVLPDPADAALLPTTAAGVTPVVSTPDALRAALAGDHDGPDDIDTLLPSGAADRYAALVADCLARAEATA